MSEHSLLAPSAAERWARCVGSLHLSKGVQEADAEYSASGSCSHWILEQSLKNEITPDHFLGRTLEFSGFKFKIEQDRIDRVKSVMASIYREPGQMWVEEKLDTSPIFGRPNQMGHADVIKLDLLGSVLIKETPYTGVLSVHDFKDGYIRVMAQDNLQGLNYLAAALYKYDMLGEINALRFCIHQPVIGHYDEWSYTRQEIETFVSAITPVAQLAYDIYHGVIPFDPAVHLTPGEAQCYWCPVRGKCPARAKRIVELFAAVITGHEIDDAALSKIYMRLDEIEGACRDYRKEALSRAVMGRTIEGQKLVQGRVGPRKWTDPAAAETALSLLLPEEKIYQPKEIISPTKAETYLKKEYPLVAKYVDQKPGTPHLAPIDDPRPAVPIIAFTPVKDEP